jgi:hypothetical protein
MRHDQTCSPQEMPRTPLAETANTSVGLTMTCGLSEHFENERSGGLGDQDQRSNIANRSAAWISSEAVLGRARRLLRALQNTLNGTYGLMRAV